VSRALLTAAGTILLTAATVSAQPAPARVQVSAAEFSFAVSRTAVRKGPVILQVVNYGEDDHDLAVRRIGGGRTYRTSIVHPGDVGDLEVRLTAGRYNLWCTLADHRRRGMEATLVVR
jgi:uncharacterized cupredoxin-like copper-binding protein